MRLSVFLAVLALGAAPLAQAPKPTASELAAKVQAQYATVRDFTADFTLTEKSVLRPTPSTDRGTLKIKKPLKMRWTFDKDKTQYISDGVKFYAVFPQDKYVNVSSLPRENESSPWLLLLAGRGSMTRDFTPSMPADQPASEWRLTLKPSSGRISDIQTMTLDVDRVTYQLRGMTIVDDQGTTLTYRFANLQENRNLSDREFVFENPRGLALRYE